MTHILVVEDDAHNATLFRNLLEKRCNARVTITESVDEVLEAVRGGGVRLVLMDVSLAHSRWQGRPVGGIEITRLLKQDPRTAAVPVVLATAHAMRGDAEALLAESGADGYVSKPIVDHDAFIRQIREHLAEAA